MSRSEPLDAMELADAAVSAALVFSLMAIGRLLGLGLYFQLLATIVFATLATRRRGRASALSTASAAVMALLLGGVNPIMTTGVAGLFGWAGGVALRKKWGWAKTLGFTCLVGWPVVAGFTLGLLTLFSDLRELTLTNIGNQWRGNARIFSAVGLDSLSDAGSGVVDTAIEYWWVAAPLVQLFISVLYGVFVRRVGGVVAHRVNHVLGEPRRSPLPMLAGDSPEAPGAVGVGPPAPVPLEVRDAALIHRSGATLLDSVNFSLGRSEFVGLAGPNGVGKTTLLRALSGQESLDGLLRDGRAGLGEPGGTAYIGQRPETQVLGLRVFDDLRWGMPAAEDGDPFGAEASVAIEAALSRVGLAGFADHYTSDLSGGELQRLAIAGALLRRPSLLLSDESTAMLDPEGRQAVVTLLGEVTDEGMTVLHATHHRTELDAADRVVTLDSKRSSLDAPRRATGSKLGRRITSRVEEILGRLPGDPTRSEAGGDNTGFAETPITDPLGSTEVDPEQPLPLGTAMSLRGVGFVHAVNSPWAHRALEGIDLDVHFGKLMLVTGANGSGKTTLARVLTGVEDASEGTIRRAKSCRTGFAFQHARLQLLRATAGVELEALAGPDAAAGSAAEWLQRLGLAPGLVWQRRIDALSGGQQRRILLAGLLGRGCNVLVLDEPLAGLDADGTDRLLEAVDEILARDVAVVVVSHDPGWGRDRADSVVHLDHGHMTRSPTASGSSLDRPDNSSGGPDDQPSAGPS